MKNSQWEFSEFYLTCQSVKITLQFQNLLQGKACAFGNNFHRNPGILKRFCKTWIVGFVFKKVSEKSPEFFCRHFIILQGVAKDFYSSVVQRRLSTALPAIFEDTSSFFPPIKVKKIVFTIDHNHPSNGRLWLHPSENPGAEKTPPVRGQVRAFPAFLYGTGIRFFFGM